MTLCEKNGVSFVALLHLCRLDCSVYKKVINVEKINNVQKRKRLICWDDNKCHSLIVIVECLSNQVCGFTL